MQYQGTVKFFKSERPNAGFGFIRRDDGSGDDFFRITALRDAGINPDCLENDVTRLEYDLIEDRKSGKLKATNVRIVD